MSFLATALLVLVVGVDPGTAVFPLLKIGQGPRASALGESFTGLADDASAVYWNPAGLGQMVRPQFALSHQEWFAGIKDEIGHAVIPVGPGALGLGLVYTGMPGVQHWDEARASGDSLNLWSGILQAGYGLRLAENYRIGASLTGLYEDLAWESGLGGALDLGFSGRPVEKLGVGLAVRHIGAMNYDGATHKLPVEVAAGASYAIDMFRDAPASRSESGVRNPESEPVEQELRFTLDGVVPVLDEVPSLRAGVEFVPIKQLAVRVGYRTGPVHLSSLGFENGLSGGLGVTVGNFGVDYAFVPYGELGLTHRIGLRTVIPPPVLGDFNVCVVDAVTGEPLTAELAFSGPSKDVVTASSHSITAKVKSRGAVRAALADYSSGLDSFRIQAEPTWDTIRLSRVRAEVVVGIYDAKTRAPIGGQLTWSGPQSGSVTVPGDPGYTSVGKLGAGSYQTEAVGPSSEYMSQSATIEIDPYKDNRQYYYLWKKGDFLSLMVNFETAKDDILPEFYAEIDRVGAIIKQTPQIKKIELSGHTDPRVIATKEFPSNWELSQARAEAIRQYIIDKFGVAPERLVAKGYADTRPIAPNTSPQNMYKNRRTELHIIE